VKSAALLIWLALFGGESSTQPSALSRDLPRPATTALWVGEWLVDGDRRTLSAVLMPVRGREELAGKMTFGDGPDAIVEHWVARAEGRWLRLSRSDVGSGRLSLAEDGRLVGRLERLGIAGDVSLSLRP
jgi:hypothetical protein